jgi:hypothetical protein
MFGFSFLDNQDLLIDTTVMEDGDGAIAESVVSSYVDLSQTVCKYHFIF